MAVTAATNLALTNDNALVERARAGEREAFDELYRRHSQAAWRLAQAVAKTSHDASEAVSEAFAKVFSALERGTYASDAPFRPYLLTATRNAAIDTIRAGGKLDVTADERKLDKGRFATPAAGLAAPEDAVIADADAAMVRDAFQALPERHRTVLWLIEVEGMKPREAATVLGLSPNATSQLAVRARASLREFYIQSHLTETSERTCKRTVSRLGAYSAGDLPARDLAMIDQHLAGCDDCRARLEEAEEVRSRLRAIALPIPLALGFTAADKWAIATGASAVGGKSLVVPGAGRLTPFAQRALAGAAAAFVGVGVIGATFFGAGTGSPDGTTKLARPAGEEVGRLGDVDLAADAFEPLVLSGPSRKRRGPGPVVGLSEAEPVVTGDGSLAAPGTDAPSPTFTPGTPQQSTDDPAGPAVPGPLDPGTVPSGEVVPETTLPLPVDVQVEAGGNLGGNTVAVGVGECTGVTLSGGTCGVTPPEDDGLAVVVKTPVPGAEEVGVAIP